MARKSFVEEEQENEIESCMDYTNDLAINPMSLDLEWLEQSNLYFRYSEALAQAKKERRQADGRLLLVKAEIRNTLSKVTEAGVNEAAASTKEFEEFKEAQYREDVLEGAVTAMQHRKTALQNLVMLAQMNYFATPKEPRDFNKMNDDAAKVRKKIIDRLNKKEDK